METITVQFSDILTGGFIDIDVLYLVMIVSLGYLVTGDNLLRKIPNPTVRMNLKRVKKAWRVAWLSALLGVLLFFIRGHNNDPDLVMRAYIEQMFVTYLIANAFYALFLRLVIDYFNKKT